MPAAISPLDAAILGVVEGLTEFLPVSSTGHLILAARALGLDLDDRGVQAFQIVIQAGALLAVIGIYLPAVRSMIMGLLGRDRAGLRLFSQLIVGFVPAAVVGLTAGDLIKARLFGVWPVVIALAVGGVAMIAVERIRRARMIGTENPAAAGMELAAMTVRAALFIGCAQVLAMWPGTSRSMMTIMAALVLGFSPKSAAQFSFLLALPTLGAATAYDLMKEGSHIIAASGWTGLMVGFWVSCIVAFIAVKGFLAYLTRHGMEVFGWYRIVLAGVVAWLLF